MAATVVDEMNNVGRTCTLSRDDRRWLVLAALASYPAEGARYMVRLLDGTQCQQVFLRTMHNLT